MQRLKSMRSIHMAQYFPDYIFLSCNQTKNMKLPVKLHNLVITFADFTKSSGEQSFSKFYPSLIYLTATRLCSKSISQATTNLQRNYLCRLTIEG